MSAMPERTIKRAESDKALTKQFSKKVAWQQMTDKSASLARIDSSDLKLEDDATSASAVPAMPERTIKRAESAKALTKQFSSSRREAWQHMAVKSASLAHIDTASATPGNNNSERTIIRAGSVKQLTKQLSTKNAWENMTDKSASLARIDSSDDSEPDDESTASSSSSSSPAKAAAASSVPISESPPPVLEAALEAILSAPRLAALEACDVAPLPYKPYNFFSYLTQMHGRNFYMILPPLATLFFWGLAWQFLFFFGLEEGTYYMETVHRHVSDLQYSIASMDDLFNPLLTPISFLMTFRLGRAAVRFWDARQASGKMVEICRSNMATVSVGLMSPIRLRRKQQQTQKIMQQPQKRQPPADRSEDGNETNKVEPLKKTDNTHNYAQNDELALSLLCEYTRWLTTFPIAVKHFLRPQERRGWDKDTYYRKRRYEIGALLSDENAQHVLMEYEDEKGRPVIGRNEDEGVVRVRDGPLVVLNRMHELAYDIAYFDHVSGCDKGGNHHIPSPQGQAAFYQQINEQINILYGAYGAMERIKGTPLPFVYAIHLRTFLLLYLFLWNMTSVANYGWISLPCLFAFNWSLLGIEAAAVECERPFDWNRNHLTLGRFAAVVAKNAGQAIKEVRW